MYIFRFFFFVAIISLAACKTTSSDGQHAYTNELIHESSPYLLQHAHNPVNWYPWGEKALKKAKEENKLLIISIGYSSCHWCHVMEKESFSDSTVAAIMNDHFVAIKVDREERPDVDDIYMTACQLAAQGGCGWPLNAFALPDGRPVWAGTYFPKKNWMEILEYFKNEWQNDPQKVTQYANDLTAGIGQSDEVPGASPNAAFEDEVINDVAKALLQKIDYRWGGRQGAPKFPMPANYEFLLEYHHHTGNQKALEAVTTTLDQMAAGGIYDHLGGGFARYATDERWQIPHFEKMLYDNGQLVSLYAHAYQVTGKELYRNIAAQTIEFVKRELTSPEGGFYSSLDAQSEGVEGKFYVWTKAEIDQVLADPAAAALFCDFYEVTEKGNWEEGKNILHIRKDLASVAQKHNMSLADAEASIAKSKEKLFEARSKRIRPRLDDKVLTSWNALMLKGLVDAWRAFGEKDYLDMALKNGQFLRQNMMQEDHRLNRNFKDGKSSINAFLDDYALTAQAFTALYEVTFDEKWLYDAKDLTEYALTHFTDDETGFFFYTSDLDPPLVTRKKEITDNVIQGSNSVMTHNLLILGDYFYNQEWMDKARGLMAAMAGQIHQSNAPDYYSMWCQVYMDCLRMPYEVAIVGPAAQQKRDALLTNYLPNAMLLGGETEGSLELLKDKLQQGAAYIYVCQNKVCKLPVEEVDKALELMK
ncbi:MAG: thioredoxin domain-containing protein [Saprospiraceae bacterium]